MVSNSAGTPGRLPVTLLTLPDLVVIPAEPMKQGVPQLIAWPILSNPFHHRNFFHRLHSHIFAK